MRELLGLSSRAKMDSNVDLRRGSNDSAQHIPTCCVAAGTSRFAVEEGRNSNAGELLAHCWLQSEPDDNSVPGIHAADRKCQVDQSLVIELVSRLRVHVVPRMTLTDKRE